MIEFLLANIALSVCILVLSIALLISERTEEISIGLTSLGLFFGINYFWLHYPIVINYTYIGMYLFLGFIYSLIKTYFTGKNLSTEAKKSFDLPNHVFRWIVLFPISLFNWICEDIITDIYFWFYFRFDKVYNYLFNL